MVRPTTPVSLDDGQVVDELCARLAAGRGMAAVCANPGMPSKSAVYERMAKDEAFRTRIARAREAQQDALMDETLEMADAATAEDWQVVKLRIWARQWLAAKLAPKKYGEAMLLKHAGNDGQNLREMSDGDAAARVAAILEAARRRENLTALRDSGAAQSEPCRSDHA